MDGVTYSRAAAVAKLLEDDVALQEERQKHQRTSRKLRGYTRAEMQEASTVDDVARSNSWVRFSHISPPSILYGRLGWTRTCQKRSE